MSPGPSRTPDAAWKAILKRRRACVETVTRALVGYRRSLTETLSPSQAKKSVAVAADEIGRQFADAITSLAADVGALPPVAGFVCRAVTLEGAALHQLRDIVLAARESVSVSFDPLDDGDAKGLRTALDELIRLSKALAGVGKEYRSCAALQEGARGLVVWARAHAAEERDAVGTMYACQMVERSAADLLWASAYFHYIESGEWGDCDPRLGPH